MIEHGAFATVIGYVERHLLVCKYGVQSDDCDTVIDCETQNSDSYAKHALNCYLTEFQRSTRPTLAGARLLSSCDSDINTARERLLCEFLPNTNTVQHSGALSQMNVSNDVADGYTRHQVVTRTFSERSIKQDDSAFKRNTGLKGSYDSVPHAFWHRTH